MTAIDEIKSRLDIVDIVSETVKLRHSGKNYTGFCPFHPNTKTPAFVVFPDTQTWRCFGQCNEGGDVFSFVMKREGWDFPEALRHLAERAGVTLQEYTPEEQEQVEENEHLREVLSMAVTFFQHQLRHTDAGKEALDYLYGRKLNDETIDAFALGYAPDSWDALIQHMASRDITGEDLINAGLVIEREDGSIHDRFRHRLIIPIRDHRGRMAGFGGRILRPEDVPKYLNSPKTPLFDKGRLLYGLDMARREIRSKDQAVIVEGYLDVIGPYQAGFKNCVSPMGTALTDDQFRLIKRYSRNIILALDPDAAGKIATIRGIEIARENMPHEIDPNPYDDPQQIRTLLKAESRLRANIKVTTLPEGLDPDEIALDDPDFWAVLVEQAKPIIIHVMETLAAKKDIEDPKIKEEIAGQVLPLIEDVRGSVERVAYRQRLARLLKVDERALVQSYSGGAPRRRRPYRRGQTFPAPNVYPQSLTTGHRELEKNCIKALITDPTLLHFIDRTFREFELACLHTDDFTHTDIKEVFKVIKQALEQDQETPLDFIRNNTSADMLEPYLESTKDDLYPDWRFQPNSPILESLILDFIRLRRIRIDEGLEQLVFLQSQDEEEDGEESLDYGKLALDYVRVRGKLDQALQQTYSQGKSHS
ncbi:MAG: DNA primase [Chloroflexota bacterium]|jgi:DNA primase|nr:DNA primase [Chloroflexota bacterium]